MLFSIYKVLAYVPNKENGCKVIFPDCKGQRYDKIRLNYIKAYNNHYLTYHFAK